MKRPKLTDLEILEEALDEVITQMAMTTKFFRDRDMTRDWMKHATQQGTTDAYQLVRSMEKSALITGANFATVTAANLFHTFQRNAFESALQVWAKESGEAERFEALDQDQTAFIIDAAERGKIVKFLPDTFQVAVETECFPSSPVIADIENVRQP